MHTFSYISLAYIFYIHAYNSITLNDERIDQLNLAHAGTRRLVNNSSLCITKYHILYHFREIDTLI